MLHKKRYFIVGALFVLAVILGLNGSSIGMWCAYFGQPDKGILLGLSRAIRSDEWAVFTPLAFAQVAAHFPYFNEIVRATPTDMFLGYGQTVLNPLIIFRPFQLGYLFLPFGNALAFYWCGRFLALLLVSYEFGRLLTKDNRLYSILFASMVALSPVVQWWFSASVLVEMLFAGFLSIVAFDKYLTAKTFWPRVGYLALITWCAGVYLMTVYPAWQVPLAYVILALVLWRLMERKEDLHVNMKDIGVAIIAIVVLACFMAYFYCLSADTIKVVGDTVYPGHRRSLGGGFSHCLFLSFTTMLSTLKCGGIFDNPCESAAFLDLFPFVWVLSIGGMVVRRRIDLLSVLLFVVALFVGAYTVFGFPEALAKLTLMDLCTANRSAVIFSLINLILLIRAMALREKPLENRYISGVVAVLCACIPAVVCYRLNADYLPLPVWIVLIGFLAVLNFSLLQTKPRFKWLAVILLASATLFGGALVNPVRRGVKHVTKLEVVKALKEISADRPKVKWAVLATYPIPNIALIAGVPSINSTNIYPTLERWSVLDPEGKYRDVYNRYAHISLKLKAEGPAEFRVLFPDHFEAELTVDDLRKLDVTFLMSPGLISDEIAQGNLNFIRTVGAYSFYEVMK